MVKPAYRDLDPLLHSQVRLAVMSILIGVKKAEFSYLLENIHTSKGNLSFQLSKLKEAGYIEITKSFRGNYPLTTCEITDEGRLAFSEYAEAITDYISKQKQ
jgi:DNA-binding transcriptional ArsR family regulator